MTAQRAREIYRAITESRWGWNQDIKKFFRPGEHEAVMAYWTTLPGNTCFHDALLRMTHGGHEAKRLDPGKT